jgi:hypothetical protein
VKLIILFSLAVAFCVAQPKSVTVSGLVKDKSRQRPIGYVNVVLLTEKDSAFVAGTVTAENGRFTIPNVPPGDYVLGLSFIGYATKTLSLHVGTLTEFLDLASIELTEDSKLLAEVLIAGELETEKVKLWFVIKLTTTLR